MLKFTTCSLLAAGFLTIGINPAIACPGCLEIEEAPELEILVHEVVNPPEIAICGEPPAQVIEAPFCPGGLTPQVEEVIHPHDPAPPIDPEAGEAPLIQVALLLDTSNSMDGLITQAKAQLWTIVNRFAHAKRDGVQPRFQIALFEYGNTLLPAEEGYIRQVVGFTDDLDALSAALFGLTTNGGDEYCGQVIGEALHRLPWSVEGNDFRAIYIAGNEPFTQGNIDYKTTCEEAAARNVLINTIHCGPEQDGIAGQWKHGAQIAGGSYLTINQDQALAHIAAPQDEQLAELNGKLNGTYIPYGEVGADNLARQSALDADNQALSPDAGAGRAEFKANGLYRNDSWDLVDAYAQDDFDLEAVADEDLPEAMREMTLEEKIAYIEAMAEARDAFRDQINELSRERAEHVAGERERQVEEEGDNLGSAVTGTVDDQLTAQGFEVEGEVSEEETSDE